MPGRSRAAPRQRRHPAGPAARRRAMVTDRAMPGRGWGFVPLREGATPAAIPPPFVNLPPRTNCPMRSRVPYGPGRRARLHTLPSRKNISGARGAYSGPATRVATLPGRRSARVRRSDGWADATWCRDGAAKSADLRLSCIAMDLEFHVTSISQLYVLVRRMSHSQSPDRPHCSS